jgi:hypothetical protein
MKRLLVASTMVAACKKEDGSTPVGGYAVVDPMPIPAGCAGTAVQGKASAVWKQVQSSASVDADGGANVWAGWVLEMTITLPESAKADFSKARSDSGYSKIVKTTTPTPTTGVYELALPPDVTPSQSFMMAVSIPVQCDPTQSPTGGNAVVVAEIIVNRPGAPIEAPLLHDR